MPVTDANFLTVAPAATASTDSYVPIASIDTGPWLSLAYSMKVATAGVKWEVFGANQADYSDEISVQAEAIVAAAAIGYYSIQIAVWRYYRIKIKSNVAGTPGTVTIAGIAKAS